MTVRDQLEAYAEFDNDFGREWGRSTRDELAPRAFDALRAVLELHKPDVNSYSVAVYCDLCIDGNEDRVPYPCVTIQAIATELEAS